MGKKVAIIFFGLTRSLETTIDSIKQNLLTPLTNKSFEYDIFIHTYKINGPYSNPYAGEYTANYNNADVVQLLNPKHFIFDEQQTIIDSINFEEYYTKLGNWNGVSWGDDITKLIIRNMCLALYSKKQITSIFEKHMDDYDFAIIMRPDTLMENEIDFECFHELNDNNIIVPAKDWFGGCNDRFCIGKPNVILYYGKLFDELKEYSTQKSIVSEFYLLDKLKEQNITIIPKKIEYVTLRIKND
jgi:hypothetical protein